MRKYPDKRQFRRERGLFGLQFQVTVHYGGEVKAGAYSITFTAKTRERRNA